jgi:hypothetical protein
LTFDNRDSARASLIKTRRGTWIDKSLLPLAHQECLEILRAATEAVGEEVVKMARGDTRPLEMEPPASNRYHLWGYHTPVRDALDTLRKELLKYRPPEEEKARQLAREARESARMCGCCSGELLACEPVYYGAKVYVGLLPLLRKRQIWEACYARTVLCGSCAPEWLSPNRDDVVTQLCAHCERPMVSRLEPSALKSAFCCNACERVYKAQLRSEQRAEARMKVCGVCGEEFIASRRDAKTCSKKCKQLAYRQRNKEAQHNQ